MSTLAFSARALARRNTISHDRAPPQESSDPSTVLYTEARDLHQKLFLDSLFSASYTRKLAECRWRDSASETATQTSQAGSDDESEASRPRRTRRRRARTGDGGPASSRTTTTSPTPKTTAASPAMARHTWISLWFLITAPIVLWDSGYLFLRPRSMLGGDLHWIWSPYEIYQEIDWVYGVRALEDGDGFPNAQAFLNVIETVLNLMYLYLAHISDSPKAPLIGFAAAAMTLWKTVLYGLQEFFCSGAGCMTAHNKWLDMVVFYYLPNGFWLVFPSVIVYTLGKDIAHSLWAASRLSDGGRAGGRKGAKVE
ncbi:uncharacterized protein SCHCODRAFT_02641559 [Schizophyllum commune H4-8]|uniref:EXPERA domain-containing protein n=1 Tax=Schizophyllum commune (strain H4-8 / FGSC 9210) TaxID=578458 RepID=D8QJD9_SCHCM|nr:uncharacterized protein SCHCODRAFT_02641559 [Schizophyllum commune H4-8]KAI5886367.1 hypothetical protein SCHCODRAFT_02641559 [Schizophyllum commune H4-8]